MIKSLITLTTYLLNSENISPRHSGPVRLEKPKEKNTFNQTCERIAPYVLLICIALLFILTLVILVKYGQSITGTEANQYYNGNWR